MTFPKYARVLTVITLIFTVVGLTAPASAHPFRYGSVETTLKIQGNQVSLATKAPQKIQSYSKDVALRDYYEQYFKDNLKIKYENIACPFQLNSYAYPKPNQTDFDGTFTCPASISNYKNLTIQSRLFTQYFGEMDHFVTVSSQNDHIKLVFTQEHQNYPTDVKPVPNTALGRFFSVTKQFIWAGMKHIWTGYDHILFLLSIILLLRSVRKIIILISIFTVAHSITLILAGLHIVSISPTVVEPLIALTIIFVAVRNTQALLSKKQLVHLGERKLTTGGFGLIHGLGIASVLATTEIPKDYFVPSLLFFNVGVEIGQLSILLIAIPLLFWVNKLKQRREILLGISLFTIIMAAFWAFERILDTLS